MSVVGCKRRARRTAGTAGRCRRYSCLSNESAKIYNTKFRPWPGLLVNRRSAEPVCASWKTIMCSLKRFEFHFNCKELCLFFKPPLDLHRKFGQNNVTNYNEQIRRYLAQRVQKILSNCVLLIIGCWKHLAKIDFKNKKLVCTIVSSFIELIKNNYYLGHQRIIC